MVAVKEAVQEGFNTAGASSPPPHPPVIIKAPSKAARVARFDSLFIGDNSLLHEIISLKKYPHPNRMAAIVIFDTFHSISDRRKMAMIKKSVLNRRLKLSPMTLMTGRLFPGRQKGLLGAHAGVSRWDLIPDGQT